MLRSPHATARPSRSLWNLGGLSVRQLVRNVFADLSANNSLGRASELAFDFLFALFPLVFLMVTLFGFSASRTVELQNDLLAYVANFLPAAAFQLLKVTVAELAANANGGRLTLGILFALWFASGGVSSMISTLNWAHRVSDSRSWLSIRTIALGLTMLISFLLLLALVVLLIIGHVFHWFGVELRLLPFLILLWRMIRWPAAIGFALISYSLVSYGGPAFKQRRWHWITPGSAFGAFLWLLASVVFRIYLHFLNTYNAFYGSLGAVMILLVWLYVSGWAFLIAGLTDAEIERASTPIPPTQNSAGSVEDATSPDEEQFRRFPSASGV
ncbi:MAG: YihY/virulence factor BrkB family protein [Candidatus Acidiferrales bacterium]|jgi:membrane protein